MADDSARMAKRQKSSGPSHQNSKAKYRSQAVNNKKNYSGPGATSASGLQSGDVGIFVTCDKGKEKACLREMEDILSEVMDLGGDDGDDSNRKDENLDPVDEGDGSATEGSAAKPTMQEGSKTGGIEDEIQRELAEMASADIVDSKKRKRVSNDEGSKSTQQRLGLITLDIPCVTFVRFPPKAAQHDPVAVVSKICKDAKSHPQRQRSRFVKRLTPLSKVRKVMSGGVEELCAEVLPAVFSDEGTNEEGQEKTGYKYAVRVTVRNNNQVSKDEIIQTVASEVRKLGTGEDESGQSRHTVDLKGFEKLVMVEVYRNVVGMAVVGDEFESLRRFNLAEIYADGRKEADSVKGGQPSEGVDGNGAGVSRDAEEQLASSQAPTVAAHVIRDL